ncbi:sensor histidine kinase, partial [Burkholderia multivorans]
RVLGSVSAAALVDPALPHMLESFARREMLRERDALTDRERPRDALRIALAHDGTFAHDPFVDGATVA